MPAERRDKEINGKIYSILLAPPSKCMSLCNEAITLFGPVLGSLGGKEWGQIAAAMSGTNPAALDDIIMKAVTMSNLCCNEQPISQPILFDKHFDSNRRDLYPACLWALWEQVNPFLPESVASILTTISLGMESQSPKDGQVTTGLGE